MTTFVERKAELERLCDKIEFKSVSEARAAEKVANRLLSNLGRYLKIQEATGVPAVVWMVIHERESSGDFLANIANGEKLFNKDGTVHVTVLVPDGHAWKTFEESCTWAAANEGLAIVGLHNWTKARMAYRVEGFNGYGYDMRGLRSPYLWGGTTWQQVGKYTADRQFDPAIWDTQLGAMAVYEKLIELYPELEVEGAAQVVDNLKSAGVVIKSPDVITIAPLPSSALAEWKAIQAKLTALGLYSAAVDGDPGPKTRAAIGAALLQLKEPT